MARRTREANLKDGHTGRLRERFRALSCAQETGKAGAGLTTLSLTSRSHPERHVWVDTDSDGTTSLDLEDRTVEGTWDNTLKTLIGLDDDSIVAIAERWLSGEPLEAVGAASPRA